MKRIVSCQSPKEHYVADVCAVWCFDSRFSDLLSAFLKGAKNVDLVKIAGGAKAFAGDPSAERDFVMGQIKTSIRLHGTKKIALMLHRDCGAYGGSKSFADAATEKDYLIRQLAATKQFLTSEIPGVQVDVYFADFDGLYAIE
jgi:carbonic anhydrase